MQQSYLMDGNTLGAKHDTPDRLHHLDWLRVFATMLLIPFHCLEPFALNVFYINVENPAYPYEVATNLINLWHMPLFFFISGYASALALRSNTARQFLISRLKRLAVPLTFGMLVFVPLVGYMSDRAEKGINSANFLDYYPAFFQFHRGDLGGFTGGLSTHHLWFLVYLLVFSLMGLALYRVLKTQSGSRCLDSLSQYLHRWPSLIFLAIIPLAASRALVSFYPAPIYFALFFTIGFLISGEHRLKEALKSNFPIALAVIVVMTPIVLLAFTRQSFDSTLAITFFVFESSFSRLAVEFVALSWLIVIWGLAEKFLTKSNKVLEYLNTGSIAIYIMHFVPVIIMLRLMTEITASNLTAFLLSSCGALISTVIVYEVLVRRFHWARLLLGIAPRKMRMREPGNQTVDLMQLDRNAL